MPEETPGKQQVDRFIMDEIDSVPQLEALLLIWNNRPKNWSSKDMAKALYVSPDMAREVLQHLAQRRLIQEVPRSSGQYAFLSESKDRDNLLESVDSTYRKELVRVSTMIHSKGSPALRDFARAFRFKKD